MISPFSIFQKPQDVIPYIDENEKLILPICDNIVFALGKCLDPLEDYYAEYDRNQATVLGMFVKQYKLFQSYIRASRDNDIAVTFILQRVIYEAFIKMQYLISYGESAQKEYRICSYKNRYKFYNEHKDEKDNSVAGIAMGKFILDLKNEDFTIDDIAKAVEKKSKNFGGKNFSQLVEEFDQKDYYTPIYGYLSDSVHTDWGESRQLFLQETETDESSFVFNPQKIVSVPLRLIVYNAQIILESSFVFLSWLKSIDKKYPVAGFMEDLLKELYRVLSLIMVNILEDYKTDKYLYE